MDLKGFNKRHYSSPNAPVFPQQKTTFEPNTFSKPPQFRRTDHTDELNSDGTNSHINRQVYHSIPKMESDGNFYYGKTKPELGSRQDEIFDQLVEKERVVVELRERLKNIHHFYKVRIEEERNKNLERSQIFVGILEQLQAIQNEKIVNLQKNFEEMRESSKDVALADQRMSSLNKKIQDILGKSESLKRQNQILESKIAKKRRKNNDKELIAQDRRQQMEKLREQLESMERMRLKQTKRNKDMLQMINQQFSQ